MPTTKTVNFLPAAFQTDTNKKFLNATLDQLVTEPNLVPINGYVGRKFAPGFSGIDTYIKESTADRADYQLEPGVVVKNKETNEVEFHTTYPEILQKISYYGGKTTNQDNLWGSDYYSYNPRVNADAFINFSQYYWLPNGPTAVPVYAGETTLERTYYVYPDNGSQVYNFSGFGTSPNPEIVVARGGVYTFKVSQPGKKFWIQTEAGISGVNTKTNLSTRQVLGVDNNGAETGTITLYVPQATAQDSYIAMPVVQTVDLATTLTYTDLQGKLLSEIVTQYNGIDGQRNNLNGKYLIFSQYYEADADWTYNSEIVPADERYGIWTIVLTPSGSDFIVNLVYYAPIPVNNKVLILSGIVNGNTSWYTDAEYYLREIPVITATLNTLYYQDGTDPNQVGIIKIVDTTANNINVDVEIIGKQNYISPNGITFTNGLKVLFDATAMPATYQHNEYYVEGVGTAINLIPVSDLVINPAQNQTSYDPGSYFTLYANASLSQARDQLVINTTDSLIGGNILIGDFPNPSNPNPLVSQELTFKYPYSAGLNVPGDHLNLTFSQDTIGVTLPGILINGVSNGGSVPGDNSTTWHYDVNQVLINGQDVYGGQVISDGKYVYTNGNFIKEDAWANVDEFADGYTTTTGHSKIIGFAADGYPIYGPYGYSNPLGTGSSVVRMISSYSASNNALFRPAPQTVNVIADSVSTAFISVGSTYGLNPGMRIMANDAGITPGTIWIIDNGLKTAQGLSTFAGTPQQVQLNTNVTIPSGSALTFEFLAGAFVEDYAYEENSGLLDQYNGRFCVTPEFPNGTYAYFITEDTAGNPTYPYIVGRSFYGSTTINTNTSLLTPDYIVINRASKDLNPWTRRNRWFHKSIIELTEYYTSTTQAYDINNRAVRPIIEFDPDLQLINFGRTAKAPVDIFDTQFTSPFTDIEGAAGYYVDGINLIEGMRIVFGSDQNPTTKNKIWVVTFIDITGLPPHTKTIHLVEATDGTVETYQSVSVFNGVNNIGKSFWYDGNNWIESQAKTELNQPPLFDVFDSNGISFSDVNTYPVVNSTTAFTGTKLFGYKVGTGANDPVLGFPLAYKNFNNVGDILFENNFDADTFEYRVDGISYVENINSGFLHKNNTTSTFSLLNVWTNVNSQTRQMQDLAYTYDGIDNNFVIDVKPVLAINKPNFIVYVNDKKVANTDYHLYNIPDNKLLLSINKTRISDGDRIDVLIYSDSVSTLGYYQIPDNLNYNPQNQILSFPTLGELRNHIGQLSQNNLLFTGTFPGVSNIRDLYISNEPGTMLQQSAPVTYAGMFLNDEENNFVNGLQYAQQEYSKFKNKFLNIAASSSQVNQSNPVTTCDYIIKQINVVKDKSFPWFYSDMVPYGDSKNTITYKVFDPNQKSYEITKIFNNGVLGNQAVLVYINNVQQVYQTDYVFLTTGPGVRFEDTVTLNVDDSITIVEYLNTDGNWIPETPSKLGLYPKFTPAIYVDNTYTTPQTMIRGHDGSLTPVFGDFRDDLLLELEKRIFNNIKVDYSEKLVDIYDSLPGKFRNTGYTINEYNNLLSRLYLQWVGYNNIDYVKNDFFINDDPFTYNYSTSLDVFNGQLLQGSWRACYEYFYDTQRPNTNPWEMLGFSEMPLWWENTYGPAPYTGGNKILWDHLEQGYIADGARKGYDSRFARPGLSNIIPVDVNGQLLPPMGLLTTKFNVNDFGRNWNIGQFSPAETAWRNSSEYPFAIQYAAAMIRPGKYFAYGIQTNKYRYNAELDQYLITGTNNRIRPTDVDVNGYVDTTGKIYRVSGYLNWISDYLVGQGIASKAALVHYVHDYTVQLSYRMASFSGKNYLKILAEQNSPNSTNESIIIPDSNYDLVINKSTPLLNARYSAIILEKTTSGYKISGYDTTHPYVTIVPVSTTGKKQNVSSQTLSVDYYTEFTNFKVSIPYGTELTTNQQVANLFAGYEQYLRAQGFRFDYYDPTLGQIKNWQLSTKEFLFWTQQNWAAGSLIVLGPSADQIKLVRANAIVDKITNSFYGSKVVDQNFAVLGNDGYDIVRDNNTFNLSLTNSNNLIGYIELNLVQYEHELIFDNRTQFNDIIYDPVTGQRQYRLKLVGSKTGEWSGTVAAPGFVYNSPTVQTWKMNTDYLKGDLVDYKNFYYTASKDLPGTADFNFPDWLPVNKNNIKSGLLNNFARNAQIGETFYRTDRVNLESEFDRYALGLIGYRNRSYLNDFGLDDTSQVKFYQGFIKEKGTLNAINALGHVVVTNQDSDVTVSEDWAFRVGSYGSLETNQSIELVLNESYTLSNPTSLQVLANNAVEYSSLYVDSQGLYKTTTTPWSPPFLLNRNVNSNYTNDILTAGYVNVEDADYTIFDLSNISTLNADIGTIGAGSIIWTAKDYSLAWNIFRVNESVSRVTDFANALNGQIKVQTNKNHGLLANDTVLLNVSDARFSGFYKVVSIDSLTSFIVNYSGSLQGFSSESDDGPIYKLASMRVDKPTDITGLTPISGWVENDKVWVDSAGTTDGWAVYNKSNPWTLTRPLAKGTLEYNNQFGTAVVLSAENRFAVVGAPGYNSGVGAISNYVVNFGNELEEDITVSSRATNTVGLGTTIAAGTVTVVAGAPESKGGVGYAFVYTRVPLGSIVESQILTPNTALAGKFGYQVCVSQDNSWMYISAPEVDTVYVYGYDDSIPTANTSITADGFADTFVLSFVPVNEETILVRSAGRTYVPYHDYSLSSSSIIFTTPPTAGTLVVTQQAGYNLTDTITGVTGSKFGYSLTATTDGSQIVVGSTLANITIGANTYTNSGSVDVYNRSIENYVAQDGQTLFGGIVVIDQYTKVYVDNVLQVKGVDWIVFAGTWVSFFNAPGTSKIVTIETNIISPVQTLIPTVPYSSQQFGYSADICTNSCSIYVGAPYQSKVNLYNGAVYRYLNQGRVYGTILGTVQNPTVTGGDSLRINNFVVTFVNSSLGSVVSAINAANIPGVTASNQNGYLRLDSNSTLSANKLNLLPGTGTALADLGLNVFEEVDIINNNSKKSYDYFGKKVKINNNSNILVVASDIAATIENTTFDTDQTYPTTFDVTSTNFVEPVDDSGAVWIYGYLPDNRNTISYPGAFAFVEQLTPTTTSEGLRTNDAFGSDISINKYNLLIGAKNNKSLIYNGGKVYQFINDNSLIGWDPVITQTPKIDIDAILKSYVYNTKTQAIESNLDYIDPAKGKILGIAEQDITYKIDYDPAVYNNSTNNLLSMNNLSWDSSQVGQVWWDLSTVKYIDYEQGSVRYRTTNWGRVFPGSSIDIYEWVESLYPPSQYVVNGGNGVPNYADNSAYVLETYVDPLTNFTTVKYYFWVKNKTTVDITQFGRTIPTTLIAQYIRDPKSSGIKYFAAIRDDSISVYNLNTLPVSNDIILHIDYATKINNNIIHSEYALLSDTNSTAAELPQNIYNKMVDSASGIDIFGNPVPDPTLPVQSRYGIDIRPRQSMFIDRNQAIKEFVIYVNSVFVKNVISQGYDLSTLSAGEPIPSVNTGEYDLLVENLEELSYVNITVLPIGYKVLVRNDSSISNLWTIYIKDENAKQWTANTLYLRGDLVYYNNIAFRVTETFTSGDTIDYTYLTTYSTNNNWVLSRVQSYDTSEYWKYIDWYAEGFDSTVTPTYTINSSGDLSNLKIRSRDIIKILNNGQGKWYIIQVFPNIVNTIAIQDGTIELTDNLYNLAAYGMGFGNDNFDTIRFDQNPGIEIRKILEALKDNIFVNQLDQSFITLFFVFVNYVLNEQKYVDWVFKTSFINVLQKIKGLAQPPIYTKENQDLYKQYIEEVKPYKTTIREYVVDYVGNDNYNGYVTDFDVPPYYDPVLRMYRSPSGEFIEDAKALTQSQYSDWLNNYPYTIDSITVINGGSGYTLPPIVTVTGSSNGNDAVAKALITNGIVTKIQLIYAGSNYITTPVVTISGGNGTGAVAVANVKNSLIRNIKTTLVYDRYTYGTDVIEWTPNTTFEQGSIVAYGGKAYIVNQTFTSGSTFVGNYMTVYPVDKLLTANDRITAYYQPELGQPGKDFGLLQSGIDYPGVEVNAPLFSDSGGFGGSNPQNTDPPRPGDITVAADGFDSTPFDPLELNSDGTYVISPALLDSTISADYADSSLGIRPEDIIVDGGPFVYDTFRDWASNTYYDRGDIVSYNNKFWYTTQAFTSNTTFSASNFTIYNIGPYASHAPEELIPGRIFDTLDMTVYTFAVDPLADSSYFENGWLKYSGFIIDSIYVADPGEGYTPGAVSVTIDGGVYQTQAQAQVTINANGKAESFSMINKGAGYQTTPNVVVTGTNTKPLRAAVIIKPSNAPLSLLPYPTMTYRIFKDMNDNYSYLRLDGAATTTLLADVAITDTSIRVVDASLLPEPAAAGAEPGVVFINGERITYYHKDNETNTISQLRRGTAGTGASNVYVAGSSVIDGSFNQIVLDSANYLWTPNVNTTANTTANVSYTFTANTPYIRSNLWYTLGTTTATNGQGLFDANTKQASFLRQGLAQ